MPIIMFVWEETEVLRENPRRHGEDMIPPHRKNRAEPRTFCEATVLNTEPPCCPENSTEPVKTSPSPAGDTGEEDIFTGSALFRCRLLVFICRLMAYHHHLQMAARGL